MQADGLIYAIGDVHGEAERLLALHRLIRVRIAKAGLAGRPTIVHLGDYVDRGPDSFGVIEAIRSLQADADLDVVALMGNHEQMLLDAKRSDRARRSWLNQGGEATLASYRAQGEDDITEDHLAWLSALPTLHRIEAGKLIFVHAGVDPETFPDCPDAIRLWTRDRAFFDADGWSRETLGGWTVVHGHTPTTSGYPDVAGARGQRVNIDTGAVFGGRLTAAEFAPGEPVRFLYA